MPFVRHICSTQVTATGQVLFFYTPPLVLTIVRLYCRGQVVLSKDFCDFNWKYNGTVNSICLPAQNNRENKDKKRRQKVTASERQRKKEENKGRGEEKKRERRNEEEREKVRETLSCRMLSCLWTCTMHVICMHS